MNHRPALTATAAKIIHITVQLSNIVLSTGYCSVCGYVPIYCCTACFPYESYVKFGSARKCRRKFRRNFPGITVASTAGIHELIKKVRSAGSLLDKKPANKTPCAHPRKPKRNKG
jgi:hypothetical protein